MSSFFKCAVVETLGLKKNKDSNAAVNLTQKVLFVLRLNTNVFFYRIKSSAAEITVCTTNNKNEKIIYRLIRVNRKISGRFRHIIKCFLRKDDQLRLWFFHVK